MGSLATAFIISYMISAPIFGWLADRMSRWLLVGFGVTVWTLASEGSHDGPVVGCRVTDAGPGFRPEQLGQVFERFERESDSRGSGLGLSIARDLVQAHGGTIEAANDPTTGGGSVTFTLPT